jgi:transcriptional regulator with XRE-family HTH domain
LIQLRKRLGHTQESFSRELGVSLPTVGNWEAHGRLPLDIGLARLAQIAREAGHTDLEQTFLGGLEELKQDRAQKAIDILDEVGRWHEITAHLTALGQIDAAVRSAGSLDAAKAAVEPMFDVLTTLEKTLAAAQKWSWRNR